MLNRYISHEVERFISFTDLKQKHISTIPFNYFRAVTESISNKNLYKIINNSTIAELGFSQCFGVNDRKYEE